MEHCRILGCPGEYEEELNLHAVHYGDEVIVIDHVPTRVCDFCGDTLLTADTVRRLEKLERKPPAPTRMIPFYEYADAGEQRETKAAKATVAAD